MENLQILSHVQCQRIHRCGIEVLRIYAPVVTGSTPTATHTTALIQALVAHAACVLADDAEAALRAAIAQGALLYFTRHEFSISLSAVTGRRVHSYTLSTSYKSGKTVCENHTLVTYWSTDESVQYRRAPKEVRQRNKRASTKRFSLFSRATLRARANCDKI